MVSELGIRAEGTYSFAFQRACRVLAPGRVSAGLQAREDVAAMTHGLRELRSLSPVGLQEVATHSD